MTNLSYALSDSVTMLRRNLRHTLRDPFALIGPILTPAFMLVLFFYVLGGALGAGLGGGASSDTAYLNYLVPGIILLTAASGAEWTALSVNSDKTEGIIGRFRTMAISRSSVLTGHVLANVIRTLITIIVILGLGLLMGFRPTAGPIEWLETIGLLVLFSLAISWMAVPLGLIAKTPSGANTLSLTIAILLPFFSSIFVRPDTMPAWLRWFVENQPLTPVIETLRGLLTGTPTGNHPAIAIAWCVGLILVGYIWSQRVFNRDPAH
jgi:ABC-2 type transport system permease protein